MRVRPKVHRLARNRFTKDWREREGGRGAYDVEMKQLGLEPAVELIVLGGIDDAPGPQLLGVLLVVGVGSAWLFRRAARKQPPADAGPRD